METKKGGTTEFRPFSSILVLLRGRNFFMAKNFKKFKTIGILGGMGPEASANIYREIIGLAQKEFGAAQDKDYPPIVIYSLPLVDFDETGFSNLETVKRQLIGGVKKLENAGSDFIIIACNTVYYFFDQLQSVIHIPIIDITKEVIRQINSDNIKKVGIISSESTKKLKIYTAKLKAADLEYIETDDLQQKAVNEIILKVMKGINGIEEEKEIEKIILGFKNHGAQAVILACTELPLAFRHKSFAGIKIYSTNMIMAETSLFKSLVC